MTQQVPHSSPTPGDSGQVPSTPATPSEGSGLTRRNLLKGAGTAVGAASLSTLGGLVLPSGIAAAATTSPTVVEFPRGGQLREYWVQSDSFFHNIVPTGVDGQTGNTYMANQTSFWTIGFRAFTPGFGKPLPGNDDIGANTGIPGPIFRGAVGDTFRVHYRNMDTYYKAAHSISIHALGFSEASDGGWSWMLRDRPGTAVNVGDTYTYEWKALPRSVGTWPYHDHSKHFDPGRGSPVMEAGAELGLVGMLAVTDANTPPIDKEITTLWHTFSSADIPGLSQDFHCFDGFAYLGNTPTKRAKVGQRVRWRVVSLGNDFHTFHIHAHTWNYAGEFVDTVVIGPGTSHTFDFTEDAPGTWYYHCHVPIHVMGPGMGGMNGFYIVSP